jgi:hypothetical protein
MIEVFFTISMQPIVDPNDEIKKEGILFFKAICEEHCELFVDKLGGILKSKTVII